MKYPTIISTLLAITGIMIWFKTEYSIIPFLLLCMTICMEGKED